jgi:hypothetical protein
VRCQKLFWVILLCIVTVAVGPVSVSYFWEKQQNEHVFHKLLHLLVCELATETHMHRKVCLKWSVKFLLGRKQEEGEDEGDASLLK